jgi:amino acid transporter
MQPDYGLKHRILSPTEAVAQSLSSTAPTAGPTVLIPLVYALSGEGTWLVFLIAMCGVVLVAMNINIFARRSASPGSLYQYVSSSMGAQAGVTTGWALVIAYIGTAVAVTGGLTVYFNAALMTIWGTTVSPATIIAVSVIAAWVLAYMNVQLSAQTMLWFEVLSVALILTLLSVTISRAGFHPDMAQLRLEGVSPEKLRLGLVLATFSFVGFESSTALGAEVKNPLRMIPRAVIATAVFAGLFFVASAYVEVLGFKDLKESLASSSAPLESLAKAAGIGGGAHPLHGGSARIAACRVRQSACPKPNAPSGCELERHPDTDTSGSHGDSRHRRNGYQWIHRHLRDLWICHRLRPDLRGRAAEPEPSRAIASATYRGFNRRDRFHDGDADGQYLSPPASTL